MSPSLAETDLLLLGAGHAHVEVLRRFAARPPGNTRLTLVSREPHAPRASMLAGLIRGEHEFDDAHVDLLALARAAGARLVIASAEGLDLVNRRVRLAGRPAIPFDLLSLNVGGTPALPDGTGTPAKPIGQLLARLAEIEPLLDPRARIAIVGAGAGGTELALALARRLSGQVRVALVCAEAMPVMDAPARVRAAIRDALVDAGVELISGVRAGVFRDGQLALSDGSALDAVAAFWTTGAQGPAFLAASGLGCDAGGHVMIDAGLRSITHPFVFAAGDCAARDAPPGQERRQRHSAVQAMRDGPVLAVSLRRAIKGQPPKMPGTPRRLKGSAPAVMLGLGNGQGVGWRGRLSHAGPAVMRWKARADAAWMARLRPPSVAPAGAIAWRRALPPMARASLERVMEGLPRLSPARLPTGASVLQETSRLACFLDDPFAFGQIAAAAALAAVPLPGARPWTATGTVAWPHRGGTGGGATDMAMMLHGAAGVLAAEGCALTALRPEAGDALALNLGVTFVMDPGSAMAAADTRPGDALVLTKPLGMGVMLEADRRGIAKSRWLLAAIAAMRRANGGAATVLRGHGAICWAGVGARGLAGAMADLLEPAGLTVHLRPERIPMLPGLRALLEIGVADPAAADNLGELPDCDPLTAALLTDPQLSGGLLAAVPATHAESCLFALREAGHGAAIIGHAQPPAAAGPAWDEADDVLDEEAGAAGWSDPEAPEADLVVAGQR